MWSNKPVKMKLFGAWEIDKTPPDCIPRLCSLNINRLTLIKLLSSDVTSIVVAVKMQNSKRILRSNEICIPPHSNPNSSLDIDLDLSFALQYPHFIKRNCNYLQVILQRRKKYKNKTILGYKTLACGLIDMAEVLQRSTIVEKIIDLMCLDKESGKDETIAVMSISSLKSQPIDQENRRGKVSVDRADVYSDEEDFTSAEDGSDSETIEEGHSRDRNINHFRRKVNSQKPDRKFSNTEKRFSIVPTNVQQRNLKQKFISLLKRFRLPDSDVYDSEEKFQEALEKEFMSEGQDQPDIDEFFDDEEIDDLDDDDSGQEFDDVSISSTPKPSLRPFFSSCTLVGPDAAEEEGSIALNNKKHEHDSQDNSGNEQIADNLDTSLKHPSSIEEAKKKYNIEKEKEGKLSKLFLKDKDKDKESRHSGKDKKILINTLSLTSGTYPKEETILAKEFVIEQLNKIFTFDENMLPEEIIFINMSECMHSNLLLHAFERTHKVVGTTSMAEVKFSFNFLCNKIQKCCNSNQMPPLPIRLALLGSDAYVNLFLRVYVDNLSSKSPDWQNYLRFYVIPCATINHHSSQLLHKYLSSIDSVYQNYFSFKDADSSREGSQHVECSQQYVYDLFNKVVSFLSSAQTVLQVPIAEAMVTYKDKNVDDESSQLFIPFICDAKIGLLDSIYGNNSLDTEESGISASPPGITSQANERPSVVSPLSSKEQHSTVSLTPPNSPSMITTGFQANFSSNTSSSNNANTSSNSGNNSKDFPREISTNVQNSLNETIDLQIDYWTTQPKSLELPSKKAENCKFTVKNSFRNLQISRLPSLGEGNSSSLTLYFITKEKKQKIMRLGKKKEKDSETKCQLIEGISRLVCSYKSTHTPLKVTIDGVDLCGVKFFQLSTQWQTQIKSFPVVICSMSENVNTGSCSTNLNNVVLLSSKLSNK